MIWFKVEQHKDGSIKSVTKVEEVRQGSKYVCYVQAMDETEAIVKAKAWRKAYDRGEANKRIKYHARRDQGLCVVCGDDAIDSETRCGVCKSRGNENMARSRAGLSVPKEKYSNDIERRAAALASDRVSADKRRARFGSHQNYRRFLLLREVRETFEKDPNSSSCKQFRRWLITEMHHLESGFYAKQKNKSSKKKAA